MKSSNTLKVSLLFLFSFFLACSKQTEIGLYLSEVLYPVNIHIDAVVEKGYKIFIF